MTTKQCPCGSGADYPSCCGRFIDAGEAVPTAECLMRSRYSAFVNKASTYLSQTWHPSTRPARLDLNSDPEPKWLGLKIVTTSEGSETDDAGEVEFVARYKVQGRAVRLHECSRFVREKGRWYYLDGQID